MKRLDAQRPSDIQGYFRNKQIEEEKDFWKKEYDALQYKIENFYDALASGDECILTSMSGKLLKIKKVENDQP